MLFFSRWRTRLYYLDPHTFSVYFLRDGKLWLAQADGYGMIDPRADSDFTMEVALGGDHSDLDARDRQILALLARHSLSPWLRLRAGMARVRGKAASLSAAALRPVPDFWPQGAPPVEPRYVVRGPRGRQVGPLVSHRVS